MQSHVINESLKRLEPTETLCRFCNKRHSEKMERNLFAPVYNVLNRTNIIVYSSVKFNKLMIGIPRCNHCFVIHKKSGFTSWMISISAALVLAILGFVLLGVYGFFSFLPCCVLATVAPIFIKDMLIKKQGILTEIEGIKKDALIQNFVKEGWSMDQPSSRH